MADLKISKIYRNGEKFDRKKNRSYQDVSVYIVGVDGSAKYRDFDGESNNWSEGTILSDYYISESQYNGKTYKWLNEGTEKKSSVLSSSNGSGISPEIEQMIREIHAAIVNQPAPQVETEPQETKEDNILGDDFDLESDDLPF